MIITTVFAAVAYPLLAYWTWHENGFLYQLGVMDFAGSGVVHLLGGVCGLVATSFLGPRIGTLTTLQDDGSTSIKIASRFEIMASKPELGPVDSVGHFLHLHQKGMRG